MSFLSSIRDAYNNFNPFWTAECMHPDYHEGDEIPSDEEFLQGVSSGNEEVVTRAVRTRDLSNLSTAAGSLRDVLSVTDALGISLLFLENEEASPLAYRAFVIGCGYDQDRIVSLFLTNTDLRAIVFNHRDPEGRTILHHMIRFPKASKYIGKVLDAGATLETGYGYTTLHETISSKYYDSAKAILQYYLQFKSKVKTELLANSPLPDSVSGIISEYAGNVFEPWEMRNEFCSLEKEIGHRIRSEEELEIMLLLIKNGADPSLLFFQYLPEPLKREFQAKAKEFDDNLKAEIEYEEHIQAEREAKADQKMRDKAQEHRAFMEQLKKEDLEKDAEIDRENAEWRKKCNSDFANP